MPAPIEIYTTPICGYCQAAKRLLTSKGAEFIEIDLFQEPGRRSEMMDRSGGRHTVPQIFIGQTHVGGYDDLRAVDSAGKLELMLG
jgi:glutaredoxin 3